MPKLYLSNVTITRAHHSCTCRTLTPNPWPASVDQDVQYTSRRQQKRSVSVPFCFTGNEWAEKNGVPFCPFHSVRFACACARSNESCLKAEILRINVYARARGAVNNRPSLASSLARPELKGGKRTERDGTEWQKNGQNGKKNGTERKRSVFLITGWYDTRGGTTGLRLRSIEFAMECSFARKRCFDVHGL